MRYLIIVLIFSFQSIFGAVYLEEILKQENIIDFNEAGLALSEVDNEMSISISDLGVDPELKILVPISKSRSEVSITNDRELNVDNGKLGPGFLRIGRASFAFYPDFFTCLLVQDWSVEGDRAVRVGGGNEATAYRKIGIFTYDGRLVGVSNDFTEKERQMDYYKNFYYRTFDFDTFTIFTQIGERSILNLSYISEQDQVIVIKKP